MLMYLLIGLLFVLIGLSGFQFAYMFYFDRIDRERKTHIKNLERRAARLAAKLDRAEAKIIAYESLPAPTSEALHNDDENWADLIEDH